mmetsp:Transcript_14708/g.39727  ORF Transcript_14708/g.39727 Transcript_14708/m.39727 type:complete len:216 (+) Transcript_14708:612-1259(+)
MLEWCSAAEDTAAAAGVCWWACCRGKRPACCLVLHPCAFGGCQSSTHARTAGGCTSQAPPQLQRNSTGWCLRHWAACRWQLCHTAVPHHPHRPVLSPPLLLLQWLPQVLSLMPHPLPQPLACAGLRCCACKPPARPRRSGAGAATAGALHRRAAEGRQARQLIQQLPGQGRSRLATRSAGALGCVPGEPQRMPAEAAPLGSPVPGSPQLTAANPH